MSHKFLKDLTSDVMFEARGKTLNELFENSAKALFEVMCKIDQVKPLKKIPIIIEGDNLEDLLFKWLSRLIALVDIEEKFFSKFEVKKIVNNRLTAYVYGEEISPEKGNTVVKSVTNYGFKIQKQNLTKWTFLAHFI